ncbi:zinc finger CCCH domain-containing protein [Salix suchowensis]|nr:zinc finger CCCH domain-containing protein [Salix suchowensis]
MCSCPEKSAESPSTPTPSTVENTPISKEMICLTVETEDSFSSLLELAANNDVEGFKRFIEQDASSIKEAGFWYGRRKGSKQIVLDQRTPLMVAATYGSIDVLKLILDHIKADVNLPCGKVKTTALHCATSGGSINAVDAVRLLLSEGADPNCLDGNGDRPGDVIIVPPNLQSMKVTLEELLSKSDSDVSLAERDFNGPVGVCNLRVSVSKSSSSSPTLSSSSENGSPHSPSGLIYSPRASKFNSLPASSAPERKEYPIDPSLPDIKNSIYATDEFRMFSFKVRPCSRAYSHDWTECPFVHPGENARRRDPRKFHYSCVPCPDFRKGACRLGDMCEYAHGVFECWLHPAQYRTRLCKDGPSCNRQVCFFAHAHEELRPLYVSTGSAIPSPRSSQSAASVMDMAAALSLLPGSPSSVSGLSPTPFKQPMSPSANGIFHSSMAWSQPNVPILHLPGSNLQSSRLRSSLNARDIPPADFNLLPDFDSQQQNLNDLTCFSESRNNSSSFSVPGRSKTLTPSNLEELFAAEMSSPRYADQAAYLNQMQQQQSMLSPISTGVFSPKMWSILYCRLYLVLDPLEGCRQESWSQSLQLGLDFLLLPRERSSSSSYVASAQGILDPPTLWPLLSDLL